MWRQQGVCSYHGVRDRYLYNGAKAALRGHVAPNGLYLGQFIQIAWSPACAWTGAFYLPLTPTFDISFSVDT